MTIVIGFVLPIVIFLLTFPIKATIKVCEKALACQKAVSAPLLDKLNEIPEVRGAKKVVGTGVKTAKFGIKAGVKTVKISAKAAKVGVKVAKNAVVWTIRALKLLIGLIRSVIIVIEALVALGSVGIVLLFVLLIVGAAGVVILLYSMNGDYESEDKISSIGGITNGTSSVVAGYSNYYWVGDSRTVGLAITLGCTNLSDNDNLVMDDTYCARVGADYEWLSGDEPKDKLEEVYKLTNTNVVFNLGVNDLDADSYIAYYNGLSEDFIKNNNVIVMSVNPIDESKYTNGITNADIAEFNNKVKESLPEGVLWLDTYSSLVSLGTNSITIDDGLHYTTETYNAINTMVHTFIDKNVSSSNDSTDESSMDESSEEGEESSETTT